MPSESANDDIGLAAPQMGNLRSQAIDRLAKAVQVSTGQSLDLAYVDQGYSGARAASAAKAPGVDLEGRQAA